MEECQNMFWNKIDLVPPNLSSLLIIGEKPHVIGSSLLECFDRILADLSCLQQLNYEGAVISRLVYRYKRKLHSDKGFKSLQKINHVLHNYLKMNLLSVLEEIKSYIFEKKGPSREVLEWGLVTVLRHTSLFHKLYIDCLDGARYMKERFKSGDFWTAGILFLAAVSRIWVLSLYIIKKSIVWYRELKAFLPYLKSSGTVWLPDVFTLPKSVNEWLKHPPYLQQESVAERLHTSSNSERVPCKEAINICKSLIITEDLGESISRETGEVSGNSDIVTKEELKAMKLKKIKADKELFKKRGLKRKYQSLDFLKSKDGIIEFICREGVLRKSNNRCLTKHLSNEQYEKMKFLVMKQANRMDSKSSPANNNKLKRIVKLIQYYLFHNEPENQS